MKHLSPKPSGLVTGVLAAALMLLVLVLVVPDLVSTGPAQTLLTRVQLATTNPLNEVLPTEPELPFLAQDAPEADEPDNEKARTADDFNRHVTQETMAARSRPARQRAQTKAKAVVDQEQGKELKLDLGFLEASQRGHAVDLFNFGDLIGGPRLPQFDIAEGDRTWLSSRRVRHGGFFSPPPVGDRSSVGSH